MSYSRLEQAKAALISEVAAGGTGVSADVVAAYLDLIPAQELVDRTSAEVVGMIVTHRECGAMRPAGSSRISCATAGAGQIIVDVVVDDMPYLIDSVSAELARHGYDIDLLAHPLFHAERDASGALIELHTLTGDQPAESWMHFEASTTGPDVDLDELARRLAAVLDDVRSAIGDADMMRAKALELTGAVGCNSGADQDTISESAEFLRWLADGRFIFMGFRKYDLTTVDGCVALVPQPGTGLGVRRGDDNLRPTLLSDTARTAAHDQSLLVISKANTRSTVQRDAYLDYVGVKLFAKDGTVEGEARFLGLYTQAATAQSVMEAPLLAAKVRKVMDEVGVAESSHSGRELLRLLETYPRDELFQIDATSLANIARSVVQFGGREATRAFIRPDRYGRFYSVLVFLPAERYTPTVRQQIEDCVRVAFGGSEVDTTVRIGDDANARLHIAVRMDDSEADVVIDPDALEAQIVELSRSWDDDFADTAIDSLGEQAAARLLRRWAGNFPLNYLAVRAVDEAVADAVVCDRLLATPGPGVEVQLAPVPAGEKATHRFTLYSVGAAVLLSDVLPRLQHLGLRVVNELPFDLRRRDGRLVHIYDFGVQISPDIIAPETLPQRLSEAFIAAWRGDTANFSIDSAVTLLGFTSREATIIRAYMRYLRQTALNFSIRYFEDILLAHPAIARAVVDLFCTRLDPGFGGDREARSEQIDSLIRDELQKVESLDADRLMRALHLVIRATLRTNAFVVDAAGDPLPYISFKIDSAALGAVLPAPRPHVEVWVYSSRVEGVHLRFGPVARGGLRWSDRREDVRTEVLGLVKAQMVKNAVIVPVGAKGGFVLQNPPARTQRDAFLTEGVACYRIFISGLLDITDNIVDGIVVPPVNVVRHDGDDPYLVVAADKGTATFSDIANEISGEYNFWLGDAFASGGSAGYDHKAMGITAKGAWESVKRHFREIGVDTQTQDFTVVGVGDMSGDVFGNGMLCSDHIQLVAAFDHRDIFIDPTPDAASSYVERQRMFALPGSSWQDYNHSLISSGGGVWSRSAKQIDLTAEVKQALDLDENLESLSPDELIHAILRAPVDLLWNGGIGTYVKASVESDAQVGDKANDSLRVDGRELRTKVVGEGGNLGLTQLGRIEAASVGVRLNTDAIDNSAGVDTSDHEVNIKIFLDPLLRSGEMSLPERDALLVNMTDEVAAQVLRDNYEQNVVLGNARYQAASLVSVHRRMIQWLEESKRLDRAIEFLPSEAEFDAIEAAGGGLSSPELAVLLAYAKLSTYDILIAAGVADAPGLSETVVDYFPSTMRDRFGAELATHPLRRELITTMVANQMSNRAGISFAFRTREETGADIVDIVKAYVAVRRIFNLDALWHQIEMLDGQMPTDAQCELYLEIRRLIDRATRWFIVTRGGGLNIPAEVARLRPLVAALAPKIPGMLVGREAVRLGARIKDLQERGVRADIAEQVAALLDVFSILDISDVAERTKTDHEHAARLYFTLSERYDIDWMLGCITALPRDERWSTLARSALRADVYGALSQLTAKVLRSSSAQLPEQQRIDEWELMYASAVTLAKQTLVEVAASEDVDIAVLSVALRAIRSLLARTDSR